MTETWVDHAGQGALCWWCREDVSLCWGCLWRETNSTVSVIFHLKESFLTLFTFVVKSIQLANKKKVFQMNQSFSVKVCVAYTCRCVLFFCKSWVTLSSPLDCVLWHSVSFMGRLWLASDGPEYPLVMSGWGKTPSLWSEKDILRTLSLQDILFYTCLVMISLIGISSPKFNINSWYCMKAVVNYDGAYLSLTVPMLSNETWLATRGIPVVKCRKSQLYFIFQLAVTPR